MSYPATFEADYIERRSRLTVFFRLLLIIPIGIWAYVLGIVASILVLISWVVIVITGRFPAPLYEFVSGYTRFLTRLVAYGSLLCDRYPSFGLSDDGEYPIRMRFTGPLERYSRLKTLFRLILAIPILIMRYVMQLLLEIGAFAAWFVILVIGRMPRGLFDVMVLANSYTARSDAYIYLLTETYPPFQDEHTRAAGTEAPGL
ncbi:MAG TPA: DUF4389 domain-containing protein [Solirubrobacteraceae bacterium]|jgi:hypothetical protein